MWHVRIIETEDVSGQRVIVVENARIADSAAFRGIFLIPSAGISIFPILPSGRKVVPVACHWEGSQDGDDFIDIMVLDDMIQIHESYSGEVIRRVGCCEEEQSLLASDWFGRFRKMILKALRIRNGR